MTVMFHITKYTGITTEGATHCVYAWLHGNAFVWRWAKGLEAFYRSFYFGVQILRKLILPFFVSGSTKQVEVSVID